MAFTEPQLNDLVAKEIAQVMPRTPLGAYFRITAAFYDLDIFELCCSFHLIVHHLPNCCMEIPYKSLDPRMIQLSLAESQQTYFMVGIYQVLPNGWEDL